jgi:hypothetical protein
MLSTLSLACRKSHSFHLHSRGRRYTTIVYGTSHIGIRHRVSHKIFKQSGRLIFHKEISSAFTLQVENIRDMKDKDKDRPAQIKTMDHACNLITLSCKRDCTRDNIRPLCMTPQLKLHPRPYAGLPTEEQWPAILCPACVGTRMKQCGTDVVRCTAIITTGPACACYISSIFYFCLAMSTFSLHISLHVQHFTIQAVLRFSCRILVE